MQQRPLLTAAILLTLSASLPAWAEDYAIHIKNRQFSPSDLSVPSGQKIKLTFKNDDAAPVEFESTDLNREKIIPPGSTVTVFIGPLAPGSYKYFDDFHQETTATITAK